MSSDGALMAESVEVGRRVRLPGGAQRPIQVFVNGQEQAEGRDYTLHGREIVFSRPLVKEKVSGARWAAMLLGLVPGCQKREGPAAHAGKEVDNAVERVGQQIEKAGDAIQDAAKGDKK